MIVRSLSGMGTLLCLLTLSAGARGADDDVDYLRQIKPLLRERCGTCHGALKQKAGLRLDTAALLLKGGDSGPVVERDDPSRSLLLERISATDPNERMPPPSEGEPLSPDQIGMLRRWIEKGAPAPADEQPEADPKDHWAFRTVVRPPVPVPSAGKSTANPIDAFLAFERSKRDLTPRPEAPRIVLLRRLYLDLIGLPPTIDEIAAFENDRSSRWYENVVDRLLDDPRHGERWARHWMDIWRYSDWWGLGDQLRNSQKHIWHWRDWIVESLNSDTPYDEMVRLMLAADELHPNDLQNLRATGYLARNYFLFNRPQWMEETVEHVSKGFLGLTMNCARCHDHKFDPFEHADYYRMRAFFEPYHARVDVIPGESDLERDGIPRVYDGLLDTPTYRYIRGDEKNPDKSVVIAPGVPAILAFEEMKIEPVALPPEAWQPERRRGVLESYETTAQKHLDAAEGELRKAQEKFDAAASAEMKARDAEQDESAAPGNSGQSTVDPAAALAKAKAALVDALADVAVAEAAVALARAERDSIERRIEAQRTSWSETANATSTDAVEAAIRAERQVTVAKARQAVAVAERGVQRAADDKKAEPEKALAKAHEGLEQATMAADAEIKSSDRYVPLAGAAWTPTRFFDSTKDDPKVGFSPQSSGRRTALAKWMTDRRNPLTSRVAVNHIWSRHLGQSLVPTVFDFGRKGTKPAHPELLDWLASEFMDHGWSMKHLHRLIVTSDAYRMGSELVAGEKNASQDPENRFWWRRVPIRIESQVVRDSILALGGTLDPTMGGPPVPADKQNESTRRSLYFFHSNNYRNLFLTTFDEALVKDCYRREQSIVPQQALALTNSRLVLDSSQRIAQRLSAGSVDKREFIRRAFAGLLGIAANDAELDASAQAIDSWRGLAGGSDENARAQFIWVLINHNDFVTLR